MNNRINKLLRTILVIIFIFMILFWNEVFTSNGYINGYSNGSPLIIFIIGFYIYNLLKIKFEKISNSEKFAIIMFNFILIYVLIYLYYPLYLLD